MKNILCIVLLLVSSYIFGQDFPIIRTLEWQEEVTLSDGKQVGSFSLPKKKYFHFTGAVYDLKLGAIPYCTERIQLSQKYTDVNVLLRNIVYEDISSEVLRNTFLPDTLNSEIELQWSIASEMQNYSLLYTFMPFRKNQQTGRIQRVISYEVISQTSRSKQKKDLVSNLYSASSRLSSGKWVKIKIPQNGVYRLTYEELRSYGIENPEKVRIFGFTKGGLPLMNNVENEDDLPEIKIHNENQSVIFYGNAGTVWEYNWVNKMFHPKKNYFSDVNYYFLTSDLNTGFDNRITDYVPPTETASRQISTFLDYKIYESDEINCQMSGREWYGNDFSVSPNQVFSNFNFPNLSTTDSAKISLSFISRCPQNNSFTVTFLDKTRVLNLTNVTYSDVDGYAKQGNLSFYGKQRNAVNGQIDVNVVFSRPTISYQGWLDYINVNAVRELSMSAGQFPFRYIENTRLHNVVEIKLNNVYSGAKLWDITNCNKIENIPVNTGNTSFLYTASDIHEFIAFDSNSLLKPELVGVVQNQNLHSLAGVQMVILTHENFLPQANELASLHSSYNNFNNIAVVSNEQVYNEFSSGMPDVSAIRNLMRMLYTRANGNQNQMPRYLLLFGDGSYDVKNILNKNPIEKNTNFVLTFQSPNSLDISSYTCDDYFGLLDETEGCSVSSELIGLIDVGVGRLPVKTEEEANIMVAKIKKYISHEWAGEWRNIICLIADDEDSNEGFTSTSEKLASIIKSSNNEVNIEKVYLGAFQQPQSATGQTCPDANALITNRVKKGALIVNYVGHGNQKGLTHERAIGFYDIGQWDNDGRLPVFMTATCEFSRWDDWQFHSAGETILLSPVGGAVSMFTTSRLVWEASNDELNQQFYYNVFKNNEFGSRNTFGDILRKLKNDAGYNASKNNFSLLGDPALAFPLASKEIKTTSLNNKTLDIADTLKALMKVKINGSVNNEQGEKLNNFNGNLYCTVFDKAQKLTTLPENRKSGGTSTFEQQNSALFRGIASIRNGDFSLEFIMPKDINYSYGNARVSYYAVSENDTRAGLTTELIVGGLSTDTTSDKISPQIKLYLNDCNFPNGGITNSEPIIYAELYDESGINTVGSGIGHDIIATIDDNVANSITLNDFYTAEKDNYKKGKIKYALSALTPGSHTLKLKAWDVFNNSAEASIDFIVSETNDFTLEHVLNYPNPFTSSTWFYFNHNRPFVNLDVMVQVFTISGKLVKTIKNSMTTTGFLSQPLFWDGLDDYGSKIGKGVYIYKLKVQTETGETAEKYEKLLILK